MGHIPRRGRIRTIRDVSIRVVVIDDHELVRSALSGALSLEPGISVAGTCSSMAEAVALIARVEPDVALVDLRLGRERPIDRMAELLAASAATRVLVVTGWATGHGLGTALAAGARGVLSKSQPLDELVDGVRRVARGEVVICPELVPALVQRATAPSGTELDARDFSILERLVEGRATGEIAGLLCLSEHTVRNRIRMLLAKLGAHTRAEAVAEALRRGLVLPAEPDLSRT